MSPLVFKLKETLVLGIRLNTDSENLSMPSYIWKIQIYKTVQIVPYIEWLIFLGQIQTILRQ